MATNLGVILSVTFLGRARKVTSSAAGDVVYKAGDELGSDEVAVTELP
jgi:hypothetical protein